ncbi:MAG: hypothetical protein KIS85_09545 [Anaerolineales bacterium]|nr:hypothetical protein [Anaerolineales bacterium]
MNKLRVFLVALLTLPAFLLIFQPSWQLGGLGLILGFIGNFISPLAILYLLYYYVRDKWH